MAKTGKKLIAFNVFNGKFECGGEINDLNYLTKFSKDKDLTTKNIYGDGEKQLTLVDDNGYTGILGMTSQDDDYNKAIGIAKDLSNGVGEMQQLDIVNHNLYFETNYVADGVTKVKKVWVFGVETKAPSESLDQNTEDINFNNVEYNITIHGTYLKASSGTEDYVDTSTGRKQKVYTLSCLPEDTGYATFGDALPVPKVSI